MNECVAALEADDFSLASHRMIFLRMKELHESKTTVDIVTLCERLRSCGDFVGGDSYVASLTEGMPRTAKVADYIAIVKEKVSLRRIIAACSTAIEKCQEQVMPAKDIIKEMGQQLRGKK